MTQSEIAQGLKVRPSASSLIPFTAVAQNANPDVAEMQGVVLHGKPIPDAVYNAVENGQTPVMASVAEQVANAQAIDNVSATEVVTVDGPIAGFFKAIWRKAFPNAQQRILAQSSQGDSTQVSFAEAESQAEVASPTGGATGFGARVRALFQGAKVVAGKKVTQVAVIGSTFISKGFSQDLVQPAQKAYEKGWLSSPSHALAAGAVVLGVALGAVWLKRKNATLKDSYARLAVQISA